MDSYRQLESRFRQPDPYRQLEARLRAPRSWARRAFALLAALL
jgi:hypothetical protein